MTNTYQVLARCIRPFTSWLEVEADSPEEALANARLEDSELIAAAEDSESWPWDEYAIYDRRGTRLLHVLDDEAQLRNAAPELRETLVYVAHVLANFKPDSLRQLGLDAALEKVEKALAHSDNATRPLPADAAA
jgi:hypothetical protein